MRLLLTVPDGVFSSYCRRIGGSLCGGLMRFPPTSHEAVFL